MQGIKLRKSKHDRIDPKGAVVSGGWGRWEGYPVRLTHYTEASLKRGLKIPKVQMQFNMLVELLGPTAAAVLVMEFGGQKVPIPHPRYLLMARRNRNILRDYNILVKKYGKGSVGMLQVYRRLCHKYRLSQSRIECILMQQRRAEVLAQLHRYPGTKELRKKLEGEVRKMIKEKGFKLEKKGERSPYS